MPVQTLKQKQQAQDKERQAYAFFTSQGWKPHQAIGIVGNLKRESGLNHNAVGDSGQALGLAQWHPDRQQKAKQLYGENWKSFENQLKFVDWELNNTEKSAGDKLRNSKGVWEAGMVVSDYYERPKVRFNADDARQAAVSDLAIKFKGIKLTPEDMPYYGATYANSVAPYMNPQDESQQSTSDINYFNIPQKGTTFASVPTPEEEKEPQEKEKQTEEDYATSAEAERVEKESNFLKEIEKLQNQDYAHLEPQKTVEQEEVQPVDYLQKYDEISQFIDEPIMGEQQNFQQQTAQQGLTWQEKLANRPKKLTVAELIAENNARQPQQDGVQRDNTQVNTQKPNVLELKNIIKDNDELEKSGAIKTPKAEANKFEKFLPDNQTVDFFNSVKKNLGEDYLRPLLKIQYERGNPSVNIGTDKGLPFHTDRNYNPFTNEVNIRKRPYIQYNIYDYIKEVSHAGQPLSDVVPRFLTNDVPGYIKSYLSKGNNSENIDKYVYNNPNTVESYTHNVIEPKLLKYLEDYDLYNYQNIENKQQGGEKQQNYAQQAIVNKPLPTGHYKTTTGKVVVWGTPEYEKAYHRGEVVTDKGVKSPVTMQGQKLDEVVVKNDYKRGFWEKYKDKIVEENKDAGVLGAIVGTPISAVASLPQLAMMEGLTGKVQRPSEAMNIQNPYGAMAVDAVTDPANLIGAGVLTKEKLLAGIRHSIPDELRQGLRVNGLSNQLPSPPSEIYIPIHPSDNSIDLRRGGWNGIINGRKRKMPSVLDEILDAKFIPWGKKRVLPENLNPKVTNLDDRVRIELLGEDSTPRASLTLREKRNWNLGEDGKIIMDEFGNPTQKPKEWMSPEMINVNPELQGNRTQDLLYQLGIEEAKKRNLRGIYSGETLLSPEKTKKAYDRFDKEIFKERSAAPSYNRYSDELINYNEVGLTGHKNPELHKEWLENYNKLNKFQREKLSIKELSQKPSFVVPTVAFSSLGAGAFGLKKYQEYEEDRNKDFLKKLEDDKKQEQRLKKLQQGGEKQQKYTENELAFLSEIAIKDNNGQWTNPGKITEINSNQITMQGVDYPLLGISKETGETKKMFPNKEYKFGKKTKNIIELPLFKK